MSHENPLWGEDKIANEMELKLGIERCTCGRLAFIRQSSDKPSNRRNEPHLHFATQQVTRVGVQTPLQRMTRGLTHMEYGDQHLKWPHLANGRIWPMAAILSSP
jgi:hypothetical protein